MQLCVTCGTQFGGTAVHCPICEDERQYVGLNGQQWTTLEQLRHAHHNVTVDLEPRLTAVFTEPKFAIGNRALLIESAEGNVLWDCVPLLDDPTHDFISARGGLAAIAISHPHYYSTMLEWSAAFGGIPVYLHEDDRQWVMRTGSPLRFWRGETLELHDGLTLIRGGGHFDGGTLLHWPAGAEGRGALLSGDIIQVVPDRRWVSFMYSYPNFIPLPAHAVEHLVQAVEPFEFARVYGAFHPLQVMDDGKAAVRRSAARYLHAIGAKPAR